MKRFFFWLTLFCCLLTGLSAQAKSPAREKSAPAASADESPRGPAETVDVPGKVIKEPNAFHGTKWGTPMAAVPDLTVVEKDGQAAYGRVEGAVYRIADVFMADVVYGFCQDKFAAVMVEYKGRKGHGAIRDFLAGKYGKPVEVEGRGDDLGWPVGNILIRMQFSPQKDAGTLSYFYLPLFEPCSGPDGNKAAQ